MQSGNPDKNAKAVNLNPWLYSPHNSRAQGREPRTKTWGFGTQDTPSGPRPPSTASEDTRVPACPPCSHHEKELPSEGTQPHPEEGSLRGEQGGAMGSEQGRGDEMTWEVGPNLGIKPASLTSPALQANSLPLVPGKPNRAHRG